MATKTELFKRTVLSHIHEYICGQGYFFTKQMVANLYLSLKTRPFAILAGISGTGKTQLIRQFAAALGCADRCTLIPVKPDWTDHTDLIGYTDLHGNFQARPLYHIIRQAQESPEHMFFVILDEMNLARVEYYFSDFLSILETRTRSGNRIVTDPLRIYGTGEAPEIYLPDNLYIIGTVNMDETTHPFSRKVLDRANTIEMNTVQLDWPTMVEEVPAMQEVYNDFLKSSYLHIREVDEAKRNNVSASLRLLKKINRVLSEGDLQFGYRIRDEVIFYMLNRYEIRELVSENEALDFQIMQKILPRIHGSSQRIRAVLLGLIDLFTSENIKVGHHSDYATLTQSIGDIRKRGYVYPLSLEKLLFMYRRYEEDGFTSYWS